MRVFFVALIPIPRLNVLVGSSVDNSVQIVQYLYGTTLYYASSTKKLYRKWTLINSMNIVLYDLYYIIYNI